MVLGRVVRLVSSLASRLAGLASWRMVCLARLVPSLVADSLPWLTCQFAA